MQLQVRRNRDDFLLSLFQLRRLLRLLHSLSPRRKVVVEVRPSPHAYIPHWATKSRSSWTRMQGMLLSTVFQYIKETLLITICHSSSVSRLMWHDRFIPADEIWIELGGGGGGGGGEIMHISLDWYSDQVAELQNMLHSW